MCTEESFHQGLAQLLAGKWLPSLRPPDLGAHCDSVIPHPALGSGQAAPSSPARHVPEGTRGVGQNLPLMLWLGVPGDGVPSS